MVFTKIFSKKCRLVNRFFPLKLVALIIFVLKTNNSKYAWTVVTQCFNLCFLIYRSSKNAHIHQWNIYVHNIPIHSTQCCFHLKSYGGLDHKIFLCVLYEQLGTFSLCTHGFCLSNLSHSINAFVRVHTVHKITFVC